MMGKVWTIAVIACLLCRLVGGSVLLQQVSLDCGSERCVNMCPECNDVHEEDLGVDMCPECRPLPTPVPKATTTNIFDEDVPVGRESSSFSVPKMAPSNVREEDIGVDMCPECRPLPTPVPKATTANILDEDVPVDMCPGCESSSSSLLVPKVTPSNVHVEDVGIDMYPECRPLPTPVPKVTTTALFDPYDSCPECPVGSLGKTNVTSSNADEEDLGTDMCPECRPLPTPVPKVTTSSILVQGDLCPECPVGSLGKTNVSSSNVDEEDLGTDMCPECRPLPAPVPKVTTYNLFVQGDLCPECKAGSLGKINLSSFNVDEEDLGTDMCPECRSLPTSVPKVTTTDLRDPDDLRPGCLDVSLKMTSVTSSNGDEEDLGIDMCPECRPLPTPVPKVTTTDLRDPDDSCPECALRKTSVTSSNVDEEDLVIDMYPDCRPLPTPVPEVTTTDLGDPDDSCPECALRKTNVASSNVDEEDLGTDMCPECRPLPTPVPKVTPPTVCEEDLGVDMCPEKGQPMSEAENHLVHTLDINSKNMVEQLQELVKVQQLQIDQLGKLLQQLSKTQIRSDLVIMDLPKERMPSSTDALATVTVDEVSVQQPLDDMQSLALTQTRDSLEETWHGTKAGENLSPDQVGVDAIPEGETVGNVAKVMTVARYKPAWSEHFSLLSAVKVDGEVSCLHVLPQERDDGVSRYVVVGDVTGRLYIFLWLGDLLLVHPTLSTAPITTMLSYTVQKNETILVTGHADGGVIVHQIWETIEQGPISKDGSTTLSSIETLYTLVPPSQHSLRYSVEDRIVVDQGIHLSPNNKDDAESEQADTFPVVNLEMYKVGKMRYTLVGDMSGKIRLFRDNGSVHGVAQSPSRPLAFMRTPSAQRLVFLTEVGVGSLDLRSMQVRSNICEGLNSSTVVAYAFDVTGRTKAHGLTSHGDLVSVALTGDMRHFECHVKKKRKVEIAGPFATQSLKGYLVAATPDLIFVFNTTLQTGVSYANFWVAGPTPLFSETMNKIALSFQMMPVKSRHWPVIASNRDKLLVVGFGDGYVGVFRSNLPTTKPADFSAKFWNSSILISALVFLVMWQLFTRKRDPAAVVVPEYPLTVSSEVSAYEKEESVRQGFGQTEKVPEPRRFRSPTRGYVAANSPSFGGGSRRFTSSAVDAGGYSSRREPLFASTQPVGDLELLQ